MARSEGLSGDPIVPPAIAAEAEAESADDPTAAVIDVPPEIAAQSLGQSLRAWLSRARNGDAGILPVVIALVAAAVMQVVLSATRFGRHTFAVGSNREAGRRVGLKVDAHRMKLYTISGLLAGLGGFLSLALYTNTTIAGHSTDNLVSIAAVIIGGTSLFGGMGSVLRSVAGVLVPVVLQNGFVIMGLQPFW